MRFSQALTAYKYLKATKSLNDKVVSKIKDVLYEEYAFILELASGDGSFRREKQESKDAIWFTAFITKLLHDAHDIIEVDENLIKNALNYLASKQNKDGSFPIENESPHYDQMKVNKGMLETYLTAFVTITFLKTYNNTGVTSSALSFLSKTALKYDLDKAITVYTLALVNRRRAANETELDKNYKKPVIEDFRKKSLFSEVVSFNSLLKLEKNLNENKTENLNENVIENVEWLIKESKHFSSFDKILATEAICEFLIKKNATKDDIGMTINDGGKTLNLNVNDSSASQHENLQFTGNSLTLNMTASGSGNALVNVLYDYVIQESTKDFYLIGVQYDDTSHKLTLNVQAKVYSNMPVVEVELPSGYEYKTHDTATKVVST